MQHRPFANLALSPIAFGAFKIGRNVNTRYGRAYDPPDDATCERLLHRVLDLGINVIDTAPAYGLSEQRIGSAIAARRSEYFISTKVGERFDDGRSAFDYSGPAVRASIHQSLRRLRTEVLDFVFVHSDGHDERIMNETDCVPALQRLRDEGVIRYIGLSGKTVSGAAQAMQWADVLMVTYHAQDRSHETVIRMAAERGIGIFVKKGLDSGHLAAAQAIGEVLKNPGVTSLVIGSLNEDHVAENVRLAQSFTPESNI